MSEFFQGDDGAELAGGSFSDTPPSDLPEVEIGSEGDVEDVVEQHVDTTSIGNGYDDLHEGDELPDELATEPDSDLLDLSADEVTALRDQLAATAARLEAEASDLQARQDELAGKVVADATISLDQELDELLHRGY